MGLFDDLLGKSSPAPTGGANPPVGDASQGSTPVITSDPTPLTPMSDPLVVAATPVAAVVEAPTASPVVIVDEATPLVATPESATLTFDPSVLDLSPTPVKVEASVDGVNVTPVHIVSEPVAELVETPVVEVAPPSSDESALLTPSPVVAEELISAPEAPVVEAPVVEEAHDLFGLVSDEAPEAHTVEAPVEEVVNFAAPVAAITSDIQDTRSYLEKSLRDLEPVIAGMDARHEAKLAEAQGYKEEKEKFAKLERQAEREASDMVADHERAKSLQAYLQAELDGKASEKGSVSTELASLDTKQGVSKAMKRQPQKSKMKVAA